MFSNHKYLSRADSFHCSSRALSPDLAAAWPTTKTINNPALSPFSSQSTLLDRSTLLLNITMALAAPKVPLEERIEATDAIERKAQALANQIKKSKHFIAFTGAGVSTSAGNLQCRTVYCNHLTCCRHPRLPRSRRQLDAPSSRKRAHWQAY